MQIYSESKFYSFASLYWSTNLQKKPKLSNWPAEGFSQLIGDDGYAA